MAHFIKLQHWYCTCCILSKHKKCIYYTAVGISLLTIIPWTFNFNVHFQHTSTLCILILMFVLYWIQIQLYILWGIQMISPRGVCSKWKTLQSHHCSSSSFIWPCYGNSSGWDVCSDVTVHAHPPSKHILFLAYWPEVVQPVQPTSFLPVFSWM